jgi:hypothetical protein
MRPIAHGKEDRPLDPCARFWHEGPPPLPDRAQPALCIRTCVEGEAVDAFITDALDEIRDYIAIHHAEVQGPPFAICRSEEGGRMMVEVGWPVEHAQGEGRIFSEVLPAGLARRGGTGTYGRVGLSPGR